ncbi:hypothetical protein C5E07_16740 [Pseudoclavibacter sp. RFBJ3]|nr:hypothetical protein C5C12_00550 [Pseudoclavibacter sp. RFBJ5]PPF90308.1 hypothetical protein C5E07_16740 [Pseudoclavibacter sp. RFBJ3]PPG00826.1 hypothetical protein C5C19_01335 [Pseudoclavibacter sp. RFBH5]
MVVTIRHNGLMATDSISDKPATSFDVARLAGVSRSTVSNILNGKVERFPEATRERVLEAARELRYQPSPAGRSLVMGKSGTVVVLVPNATFGSNLQDAVESVVQRTRAIGGNVVVRFATQSPGGSVAAVQALQPLAVVDLGVLSSTESGELTAAGVLVVPADRDSSVVSDGGVARLQIDELLRRGPRQLWFAAISDARSDPYGPSRLAVLEQHSRERGLSAPKFVRVSVTREGGTAAVAEIMSGGAPAAVACYNDDVALALLAGARERSVSVPAEMSVIGVDDTTTGALWSPALSSVRTTWEPLVEALARELEERLGADVGPAPRAFAPFEVITRETT